jgi:hypothetical protein
VEGFEGGGEWGFNVQGIEGSMDKGRAMLFVGQCCPTDSIVYVVKGRPGPGAEGGGGGRLMWCTRYI